MHRSTRADWQLLRFICARRLGLTLGARLQLVDALRRSLVAPMALLLMLLVLAGGVLPLGTGLLLVLAALGTAPLLDASARFIPRQADAALGPFCRAAGIDLLRACARVGWNFVQLLQHALVQVDAIGRALHHQLWGRRWMLEASPHAMEADSGNAPGPAGVLRRHWPVPLFAALVGGMLWWQPDAAPAPAPDRIVAALLFGLWGSAPLWIRAAGRRMPRQSSQRIDQADRDWLQGLARDNWRYHDHYVGAAEHHLPPDSVQHAPHASIAQQATPAGIGLYLLAAASAQSLGFIGREEMVERLSATLDTLDRLPRHRGHLLGRYDIRTLEPVAPAAVSSQSSGELCVCLLAVAAACEALAAVAPSLEAAEQALQYSARWLHALRPLLANSSALHTLAQLCAGDEIVWPRSTADLTALRARVQQALDEFASLHPTLTGGADETSMWLARDHVAMLGRRCTILLPMQRHRHSGCAGSHSAAAASRSGMTSPGSTTPHAGCCAPAAGSMPRRTTTHGTS